ncbi:MAG: YCF48-related protein, partial [Candidatus Eisenbacteria bacterium]
QTSGTSYPLWKCSVVSADTCWASGFAGTLTRTIDGGVSWSLVDAGTNGANLWGVEFINGRQAWLCGEHGLIMKTKDGGESWVAQTSGTNRRLYDIEFADSLFGWAVGDSGVVLHTVDGGRTWQAQASGVYSRLYDVCFADKISGWAVGSAGRIICTIDGGVTWVPQVSGVLEHLYGVCFLSNLHGWAVGENGAVVFTQDCGEHWSRQQTGIGTALYGVSFANVVQGWICGASCMLRTVDAGIHWSPISQNMPDRWANVVATLPGTRYPSQIYVIGGHYDSLSDMPMVCAPGADDNASGTSVVVEAARILRDYAFESTIRFICFSGGENVLLGSEHYAGCAGARGDDLRGVFSYDMVGYGRPAVYLRAHSGCTSLTDYLLAVRDAFVPGLEATPSISSLGVTSDYNSFAPYGYCGVNVHEYQEMENPHRHSCEDLTGTLTISFTVDVARLAVASMASLAELDMSVVSVPSEPAAAGAAELPAEARLSVDGNSPNPFNPLTRVAFTVSASSRVVEYVLAVSEPGGRIVRVLARGKTAAEEYRGSAVWDGTDENGRAVASGVYLCSLTCGGKSAVQKIVLMR